MDKVEYPGAQPSSCVRPAGFDEVVLPKRDAKGTGHWVDAGTVRDRSLRDNECWRRSVVRGRVTRVAPSWIRYLTGKMHWV